MNAVAVIERIGTLLLVLCAVRVLGWGSVVVGLTLFQGQGEGPSFAWLLGWPLTWFIFGTMALLALVTAHRQPRD